MIYRFFEEGKSKFEEEIQNLIKKQPSSPDSLLQIDEDLLKQRKLSGCTRDFRLKLLDKTCQDRGKS
ncbi:hypothetical protein [Limnofasciculus baicalensis]|uniref:Uncharacterized protein n=1 Tax=Limnofasciculus baicalensis BBK-W-15 TaxID=2699891 RepID=A0AAE3GTR1_9CYAN|nr:hypothetical protein [Limnofasciculus baicalensis]MCP2730179.1 hypothetical protein [Limnofasciculus baicalensis BBK-W-15]